VIIGLRRVRGRKGRALRVGVRLGRGFTGESTGGKGLAGPGEAWEGPQETREKPVRVILLLLQSKKPLIDFGQFFTCNTCRQRNKRVN
jgi:hypothetical protein